MTLSGPEALRSLEEALRDIRREEDDIARRLGKGAELVTKIRETESELLRQLARVRLSSTMQEEITGRLSDAENRARQMLKKHQSALNAAEAALKAYDADISKLVAERAELVAKAADYEGELKALAEKVAADAAKSPEYAEKRKIAEALRHVAEEAMSKTLQ